MEIKTFEGRYLAGAKKALRSAFYRPESDPQYNEWEFAERLPQDAGYRERLCLIAVENGEVTGYLALSRAKIGGQEGLALGPLGVRQQYQNQGIGTQLVQESIRRAREEEAGWIVLLGGDYYRRFGFEPAMSYGIFLPESAEESEHLWVLFLEPSARGETRGALRYCGAFYTPQGELL